MQESTRSMFPAFPHSQGAQATGEVRSSVPDFCSILWIATESDMEWQIRDTVPEMGQLQAKGLARTVRTCRDFFEPV